MRPGTGRFLLVTCLVTAISVVSVPASAAPASPAQVASKRAQAARLSAELRKSRRRLAAGMAGWQKASASLARTRREMADNSRRIGELTDRVQRAQTSLSSRADYMYRMSGSGVLDMLLSATTFDEFVRRFDMIADMAAGDAALLREIKKARAESRRLTTVLKARESMLAQLVRRTNTERAAIQSEIDRQQTAFGSLSEDIARALRAEERPVSSKPARGGSHGSGRGIAAASVVQHPGATYYAMSGEPLRYSETGVSFSGEASWYGVVENGTGTASGHPLDDSELTCAHRSLPFNTRLAVSYHGRNVIVVVTDRGPYTHGRVIDLSKRAADILGFDGVGNVRVDVVEPAS